MGLRISIPEMQSRISAINKKLSLANLNISNMKVNISSYLSETRLSGKAYNNSKQYLNQTYIPMLDSFISTNQAIISANNGFIGKFNSYVVNPDGFETDTDILEPMIVKLEEQNRRYEEQLQQLSLWGGIGEFFADITPWIDSIREKIEINQRKIKKLRKVIQGMYDFNSKCANIYEQSCKVIDYISLGIQNIQTGTWNPNIRMFKLDSKDNKRNTVEIFSNQKLLEEVKKLNGKVNLSKTTFEYAFDPKHPISKNSEFFGCTNASKTYTDDLGLMRVKIGDSPNPENDFYAVALPMQLLEDAHNELLKNSDLGINKEYKDRYYGGYKFQINLVDNNGNEYTLNAISFDVKAAAPNSISSYFPKDGLGTGNHDHLLEFIFKDPGTKKVDGNVVLGDLFNSSEKLEVRSVSVYIDMPLVIGNWGEGYKEYANEENK